MGFFFGPHRQGPFWQHSAARTVGAPQRSSDVLLKDMLTSLTTVLPMLSLVAGIICEVKRVCCIDW